MTAFVLDASAGVELLLDTTVGLRIQDQIPANAEWWTPEHYFVEVSGALRRALIRGVVAEALVHEAFQRLTTVPIHRAQIRPLLTDAWAKRDNLTSHHPPLSCGATTAANKPSVVRSTAAVELIGWLSHPDALPSEILRDDQSSRGEPVEEGQKNARMVRRA